MLDVQRIAIREDEGCFLASYDTGDEQLEGTGSTMSAALYDLAEQIEDIEA